MDGLCQKRAKSSAESSEKSARSIAPRWALFRVPSSPRWKDRPGCDCRDDHHSAGLGRPEAQAGQRSPDRGTYRGKGGDPRKRSNTHNEAATGVHKSPSPNSRLARLATVLRRTPMTPLGAGMLPARRVSGQAAVLIMVDSMEAPVVEMTEESWQRLESLSRRH